MIKVESRIIENITVYFILMLYFHLCTEILEYKNTWNKYSYWIILNVNKKFIFTDIFCFLFVNSSSVREW